MVTSHSESGLYDAVWSRCNRVIATVNPNSVVTLDGVTLNRLHTFAMPSQYLDDGKWRLLSFSPDGHCLTLIGGGELIGWDLQTGGPLGIIPSGLERKSTLFAFSSTYSEDGNVVAAAYSTWNSDVSNHKTFDNHNTFDNHDTFIRTYDLSGTEPGPCCTPEGRIIEPIWTHGECIRFVTINPGSVTVLEVGFTLKNPPVEVESLPISDKVVDGKRFLFLPALSRLAFALKNTIQVWDAKAAKLLLKSESPSSPHSADHPIGSFSSDGRFFVHGEINKLTQDYLTRVWKESPAGYVLHQTLQVIDSPLPIEPRLSPSGESISTSPNRRTFHLWHTRDQDPSLPSISASDTHGNNFILAFSPSESLAAFARWGGNVVTVFNPLTGDFRLAVNTEMSVVCVGMTGSALIVAGANKIVAWDLPSGDCAFNDGVRTTILHRRRGTAFVHVSISPDFSRIAVLSESNYKTYLQIYDMSTGRCLTSTGLTNTPWVGFTRDGCEVWATSYDLNLTEGWKIVEGSGPGRIRLEPRDGIVPQSEVFPWESRHDYKITSDGWVLSATQERLLWLPHRWRSGAHKRVWSGRFLGLLQKELSEIVVLEFPE